MGNKDKSTLSAMFEKLHDSQLFDALRVGKIPPVIVDSTGWSKPPAPWLKTEKEAHSALDRLYAARAEEEQRGGFDALDFDLLRRVLMDASEDGIGFRTYRDPSRYSELLRTSRSVGCGVIELVIEVEMQRAELMRGDFRTIARIMAVAAGRMKAPANVSEYVECSGVGDTCAFCDRPIDRANRSGLLRPRCALAERGEPWRLAFTDQEMESGVRLLCDWSSRFEAASTNCALVVDMIRTCQAGSARSQLMALADEMKQRREQMRSECRECQAYADQLRAAVRAAEQCKAGESSMFEVDVDW